MYSQTLEASKQALETYKGEVEEAATFGDWAKE